MQLKSLDNATKILEQVKALDKKINAIERFAHKCAEGVGCVVFEVSVREKAKEPVSKVVIDADGSLVSERHNELLKQLYVPTFLFGPRDEKKEETKTDRFELGEVESLTVFGAMLLGLQEQREKRIEKLRELGFSI